MPVPGIPGTGMLRLRRPTGDRREEITLFL